MRSREGLCVARSAPIRRNEAVPQGIWRYLSSSLIVRSGAPQFAQSVPVPALDLGKPDQSAAK